MIDDKIVDPNALVDDSKIKVTINQGASEQAADDTPPPSSGNKSWPPRADPPEAEHCEDEITIPPIRLGTLKGAAVKGIKMAKRAGVGAAQGMSAMADNILELPSVKPLKEFKIPGKVLIFIMLGLLAVSFLCFFRKLFLWGILGILVDVLVGVGLISYFGICLKALLTKFFLYIAIAAAGAMLLFCFIRVIIGK